MVWSPEPFPDLEAGLVRWLSERPGFTPRQVGDDLPSDYKGRLPYLEVGVRGGPSDGLTWFAEVEVYCFARSRNEARRILVETFASMGVYPRNFGGVSVDTVEVTEWPSRSKAHEPDEDTVCFSGEMTITLRRR